MLTRILWAGAGISVLVGGGFTWLRRSPLDQLALPADIRYLSSAQYQLVEKLIQVLLPVNDSGLYAPDKLPVVAKVDALLGTIRRDIRQQLLIGLTLFDNLAVLGGGSFGRFVDLSAPNASDYVSRWMSSSVFPVRAIASSAARLVKSAYWSFPETWPAIGFAGPVTQPQGIAALGNAPLPSAVRFGSAV